MPEVSDSYVHALHAQSGPAARGYDARWQGSASLRALVKPHASQHGRGRLAGSSVGAAQAGAIALFAEDGMGKTSLLAQIASARAEEGFEARYEDFMGMNPDEALGKLTELLNWHGELSASYHPTFLACDNVPACDESDAERLVAILRSLVRTGCLVMFAMLPEGEGLVSQMGELSRFWSCDLRIARPDSDLGRALYDAYTHGVPALHDALSKVSEPAATNVFAEPSYIESFCDHVMGLLRPSLMGEELRLRATMLLLGKGTLGDLDSILGAVDEELWRHVARDAPFFGVVPGRDTFDCVGSGSVDGLNAAYHAIAEAVERWPSMVSSVVYTLASRKEYSRAAIASLMCSDVVERTTLGLAWGPEFINVGEYNVVIDALGDARGEGRLGLQGFFETEAVLASLSADRWAEVESLRAELHTSTRRGRQADLALWCRGLLRGLELDCPREVPGGCDDLSAALALHGRVLLWMLGGHLEDAYAQLVNTQARKSPSKLTSVLLSADYLLCSMLMGVGPSVGDFEAWEAARVFVGRMGSTPLVRMHAAVVPMGRLLGGRLCSAESFEAHIQRADRSGDELLRSVFLMVAAVGDLRVGAFTRAHVRLAQAHSSLDRMGAQALAKCVRLIDLATLSHLGERVLKPDVLACRGVTVAVDRVVSVFVAALSASRGKRCVGSGRWGLLACPRDAHWLVNVLSNDCGIFSKRFREVMPETWGDSLSRGTSDVDALAEQEGERPEAQEQAKPALEQVELQHPSDGVAKLEVRLLGGFEVRVEGRQVPTSMLERRRAKALLVLLAALPGHAAKRFVIMESIWPSFDYDTANKCVYSATSVLRTELSSALGMRRLPLVLANRAERTVALNEEYLTCDVDRFETYARRLLDAEGEDRMVVSLCREVEDLYRGDLFVPPTDGRGIVESRSRQLRDLYADTMVAGSSAATRLGMRTLACRFARKAHAADGLREDAMRVLIVSLCAVGRHVEAEQSYESFVARVVDVTRRPPSRRLRELMSELMEGVVRQEGALADAGRTPAVPQVRIVPQDGRPGDQLRLDLGEL